MENLEKFAEPAPSAGWEEELSDLLAHLERAVRNGNQTLSSEIMVKEFIRTAVREASLNTRLEVVAEMTEEIDSIVKGAELRGFDEAANIVKLYTDAEVLSLEKEVYNHLMMHRKNVLEGKA